MGLTRLLALLAVAVGCGGEKDLPDKQVDAAIIGGGCSHESECASPTPYCEPTTSTCVACRFSSHCASSNSVCDGQACRPASSCKELRTELPGLLSGVYRIDVDGAGAAAPVDVFCEMTVDGGGWTLVQRTRWSWTLSQVLRTTFDVWHDMTLGNPAAGNVFRLAGMHWPALASEGRIMASHRVRTTAGSACNPLWYIGTGGTLTVDKAMKSATFAGLVQPAPIVMPPATLSSTDGGPDSALCVNANSGVNWFYGSCCSTCPTYGGSYWTDEPHPMNHYTGAYTPAGGTTTAGVPDFFGKTEPDVCGGATVRMADVMSPHRGVDTMEMYLR